MFIGLNAGDTASYGNWRARLTETFAPAARRGVALARHHCRRSRPGLRLRAGPSEILRQNCSVHGCRIVLQKVSAPDQEQVKQDY